MKISLIVSVYKNIKYLELVLQSIQLQTYKNFELIVAEDNNGSEMKEYLNNKRENFVVTIQHVFQEDKGFRKNKILNEAIRVSTGEFLVFVDGDCILHRNFLQEYAKNAKKNTCLLGRRVELGEKSSRELLNYGDVKKINLLWLMKNFTYGIEEGIYLPFLPSRKSVGVFGCNFGLYKEDILKINGFDEDYVRATAGEDSDIDWRLEKNGVEYRSLKNKAIQYHIYHKRTNREEDGTFNWKILENKKKEGIIFCKNGLNKLEE